MRSQLLQSHDEAVASGDFRSGVTSEQDIFKGKILQHRLEMRIRPSFEKGLQALKRPWGSFFDTTNDVFEASFLVYDVGLFVRTV